MVEARSGDAATRPQPAVAGLAQITLHLARCHDHPQGSETTGYRFVAPLDAEGHLDPRAWDRERAHCLVTHFQHGETDRIGHLLHRPGGAGGATWGFAYDGLGHDAEAGHHLESHRFVPNEYISIRDEDGVTRTFKVVAVQPLAKR